MFYTVDKKRHSMPGVVCILDRIVSDTYSQAHNIIDAFYCKHEYNVSSLASLVLERERINESGIGIFPNIITPTPDVRLVTVLSTSGRKYR